MGVWWNTANKDENLDEALSANMAGQWKGMYIQKGWYSTIPKSLLQANQVFPSDSW